jgi:hypothetical protein
MLRVWLALSVGVGLLVGSGVIASLATAQVSADPTAVITAYEMARNRRDVDGALAYFADDASVSVRNTQYSGRDEIRKYLDAPVTRSRSVVVSDRHASGNHVTWTERSGTQGPTPAQTQGNTVATGGGNSTGFTIGVEAIVQDGKIRSLTYLVGNQALRPDPALEGRAQLPASVGLGVVMAVLAGVVVFASMGLRRSAAADSTLRGRLMQDLKGWTAAREVALKS